MVSGASGYTVYRATSKNGTYTKLASQSAISFSDQTVSAGQTYYYKVVANGKVDSAATIVQTKAAPAAPKIKSSATVTADSVKLSWYTVSGADGYYVYRKNSENAGWTRIAAVTGTNSYQDKSAKGTAYYAVAAYQNSAGKKHAGTKSDAVQIQTLASSYVYDTEYGGNLTNNIFWSHVPNATGYQLYYRTENSKTWSLIDTLETNTYSHTVSSTGVRYYYRVRPICKLDGMTCVGPSAESREGFMHYYSPNVSIIMSDNAKNNATVEVILVDNHGSSPIRFYAEGGQWLDHNYSSFNRDIVLYDYAAYKTGRLVTTSYADIPADSMGFLLVGVKGNPTWYDRRTKIRLNARYDGMNYVTYSSDYYGFSYYLID